MSPSDQPAGFLRYIDQHSSSGEMETLFLVGAFLMLIGLATVAFYAWKYVPKNWWLLPFLGAPTVFFVGTTFSFTTYNAYHLAHDINELSKKLEETSQIIQGTSLKVDALSQTVQEFSRKINDFKCPPQKICCQQKTCLANCSSNASITIPPSESDSKPNHSAESARQADGWVYVGTRSGLEWDEKYFAWDGEKDRLPEKGDILTATGSVNLRVPLGCQARIVGAIASGEPVKVLRSKTVADCHHWVQVKRMREKKTERTNNHNTMLS